MIKIAVMGYGVVGSGVYEVIRTNCTLIAEKTGVELEIKYILDIRDFDNHPEKELFVKDSDVIANDDEVKIVVETMGGVTFAYEYTKKMLQRGKSVVTSNKELVSKKGTELFEIARASGAAYMFEAAVGGGIPLIEPLVNCLAANKINAVYGIVNGTTNYILTKMIEERMSFDDALGEAQRLGYAEKNPDADVLGYDAQRKIAILMGLVSGHNVPDEKIPTEGIVNIKAEDVLAAESAGYKIKLIAYGFEENGRVFARVCPMLIPKEHPLSSVKNVFNAVLVSGNMVGNVMFYGRGAGKEATASAIVGDILHTARVGGFEKCFSWVKEDEDSFINPEDTKSVFFIRCDKPNKKIGDVFGSVCYTDGFDTAFITGEMTERECEEKSALLGGVISKIRVYEEKE